MIHRPLLELVRRWAWLGQCGAEVSIKNMVGMDDGSIQLETAHLLDVDHVQITISSQMTISSFAIPRRSILFASNLDHSIPIGRTIVQRFSPIRF
jgi:hypothetical protein